MPEHADIDVLEPEQGRILAEGLGTVTPVAEAPAALLQTSHQPQPAKQPPRRSEPRYELKFELTDQNLAEVTAWLRLHPAACVKAYPHRVVNNIYFDSERMTNYLDHESGTAQRRKLRVRWYGEHLHAFRPVLELKCKDAAIGWKYFFRYDQYIDLRRTSWSQIVNSLLAAMPPSHPLRTELRLKPNPVLINSYVREYYRASTAPIRITVDHTLRLYDQTLQARPNITRQNRLPGLIIVELKAPDIARGHISSFCANFPLTVSKHSKYLCGLERILNI